MIDHDRALRPTLAPLRSRGPSRRFALRVQLQVALPGSDRGGVRPHGCVHRRRPALGMPRLLPIERLHIRRMDRSEPDGHRFGPVHCVRVSGPPGFWKRQFLCDRGHLERDIFLVRWLWRFWCVLPSAHPRPLRRRQPSPVRFYSRRWSGERRAAQLHHCAKLTSTSLRLGPPDRSGRRAGKRPTTQ